MRRKMCLGSLGLIVTVALHSGCGGIASTGSSLEDSGSVDAAKQPTPEADATGEVCGFEVSGDIEASVVGTKVTSYPAGSEIPFLWYECTGSAGGVSFDLSGQFIPGSGGDGGFWLTSSDGASYTATTLCDVTALLNGQPATYGYKAGDTLSMTFACGLTQGSQSIAVSGGWLQTVITLAP